jgi:hypothetical protein
MGARYGEVILEDMSRLCLTDPARPEELEAGDLTPVPFEAVARKQHKWQVRSHTTVHEGLSLSHMQIPQMPDPSFTSEGHIEFM